MNTLDDMVELFGAGDLHGAKILAEWNVQEDSKLCHTVIGISYFSQKKYEEARVEIKEAIEQGAEATPVLYSVLGRIEQALAKKSWRKPKQLGKAREYFEKSFQLEPNAITLKMMMGCCQDDYSKKAGYGELYLNMYGKDIDVCEEMLEAYHMMGEGDNARRVVRLCNR